MNVIVIAAYQRPEFLKVNLDRLTLCKELEDYILLVSLDCGYDPECLTVVKWFIEKYPKVDTRVVCRKKRRHPFLATENILSSFRDAAEITDDYIIVGEEDILVSEDYLRFNHVAYEKFLKKYPRIFSVCRKRRNTAEIKGDPTILVGDHLHTITMCITKETILSYIVPILEKEDFIANPAQFNAVHYPNSRIPANALLDNDGAQERLIEKEELFSIRPDQARSMHIGFVGGQLDKEGGYQGVKLTGTVRQKVDKLEELLKDRESIRNLATPYTQMEDFENWRGVTYLDLPNHKWDTLELDIHRTKAKASKWFYDKNNDFCEYVSSKTS